MTDIRDHYSAIVYRAQQDQRWILALGAFLLTAALVGICLGGAA